MRDMELEQNLIGRLRERDGSAVTDLAGRYGSKIYQLAFRYMGNREDAEEVAQDVLLKVFRKIEAFRGDAALSSWIYRITFNTAMSRLRSHRVLRSMESTDETFETLFGDRQAPRHHVADWSVLADDRLLRAELRARLIEALTELPPIYRVPVMLRDIQGLSTEEASVVLGVKTQTLKSRLHRGRLMLRDHLSDFSDGLTLHRTH